MKNKQAFTLIEMLVVVLVIGILAAIALPQYQKAVLKSRYSSLMPIGKAVAQGNELYYMEHGSYASVPTQLDIAGQSAKYPNGTQVSLSPITDTALSYVLVTNDGVPNARYLVYQKHSPNYAGTTMCEAGNTRANELCQALGGESLPENSGNSQGDDYTAYLLTGTYGDGDSFTATDDTGNSEGTESSSEPVTIPVTSTSACGSSDIYTGQPIACNEFWFEDGTHLRTVGKASVDPAEVTIQIAEYDPRTGNNIRWMKYDKDGNCIKMNSVYPNTSSWGNARACSDEPNCNEKFAGYNVCNLYN